MIVWIFAMRDLHGHHFDLLVLDQPRDHHAALYVKNANLNFEAPLTSLVWMTSIISIVVTYVVAYTLLQRHGRGLWWKLSTIISAEPSLAL